MTGNASTNPVPTALTKVRYHTRLVGLTTRHCASALFASMLVITTTPTAEASCTDSGLARTCNGDLNSTQLFEHLNEQTVNTYTLIYEALTNSSFTTNQSSNPIIHFLASGANGSGSGSSGHESPTQKFTFNADRTVDNFTLQSNHGPNIEITQTGGSGTGGSENGPGLGERTGGNGGTGGGGGETEIAIYNATITANPGKALLITASGGNGGHGGEGYSTGEDILNGSKDARGGTGGSGGGGGSSTLTLDSVSVTNGDNGDFPVLTLTHTGGKGGSGGLGKSADYTGQGGSAGPGGSGGNVNVTLNEKVTITGKNATGFQIDASGGNGGAGGEGENTLTGTARGSSGGTGGRGGNITLSGSENTDLTVTANGSGALVFHTFAGSGGTGGYATGGGDSYGGDGGPGGTGGTISVDMGASILNLSTTNDTAQGIDARSYGGNGGDGGDGNGTFIDKGKGGSAAGSGPGGDLTIDITGSISTTGSESNALFAQSVGGFSGAGGSGSGFIAYGAGSESAGAGGSVSVTWSAGEDGSISTSGDYSDGIFAQSQGGGGGKGGKGSGIKALAGSGSAGGDGTKATVITTGGTISTEGINAVGIYTQSSGGTGGAGGGASAIDSIGGSGGGGGKGGTAEVSNLSTVTTQNDFSDGIYVESVGGGGGRAASTSGIVSVGGSGGNGATGGTATLANIGAITTSGDHADAAYAHSIGGGGGKGASSTAIGVPFSVAIGGNGGTGNHGGAVNINKIGTAGAQLTTTGEHARGLVAYSQGGGGGHAGNTVSVSASSTPDVSVAIGGSGGAAGNGGEVRVNFNGGVSTAGGHSTGILATSTGGGGGSAGTTVSVANGVGTVSTAIGGDGSGGGTGGTVTFCRGTRAGSSEFCSTSSQEDAGQVKTLGAISHGVLVSSVGGSGGHSGVTVAGTAAPSFDSVDVGVGGDGGEGGAGGLVNVYSSGGISTTGESSVGLLVKSVGGSGGSAYTTAAADTLSSSSVNVSVGGNGGTAGGGGNITLGSIDDITTQGSHSDGISVQSTAKSGGVGGAVITGTGVSAGNAGISVGGGAGNGSTAGTVDLTWSGTQLHTKGLQAVGIYAASSGGSGGRGGTVVNGDGASLGTVQIAIGSKGGNGGAGGDVSVRATDSNAALMTNGSQAAGIFATSQGGHGGNGGTSVSGSLVSQGKTDVTLGGGGGEGGTAGTVTLSNATALITEGTQSPGLIAKSQGGNGGNGGSVIEGGVNVDAVADAPSGDVSVNVGGKGGNGGVGGVASVTNSGTITTDNFNSEGIIAQSIGGHGGNGGSVYTGTVNLNTQNSFNVEVNLGGEGGGGAMSDMVTVTNSGAVTTKKDSSNAIFAQSVGGNGGTGGNSYSILGNLVALGESSASYQVTVGGAGGSAADGEKVTVTNSGTVETAGVDSSGVYAQSIGGNGGKGGAGGNILINASQSDRDDSASSTTVNGQVTIAVGGSGGKGADAGAVEVDLSDSGSITTSGESSHGVFAQAAGGGGGDGGAASGYTLSITGACSFSGAQTVSAACRQSSGKTQRTTWALNLNIGGSGGAAGDGGAVDGTSGNDATITTKGSASHGLFLQSVGGGGGVGGSASTGVSTFTSNQADADIAKVLADATKLDPYNALASWTSLGLSIGGKGGASGMGGDISYSNSSHITTIAANSYGIFGQSIGGGGGVGGAATSSPAHSLSIGGSGAGGGNGGTISLTNTDGSQFTTSGIASHALLAQSIGGGGGDGGSRTGPLKVGLFDFVIGGSEGVSGNGGDIDISNSATSITTNGSGAMGIVAQSIGAGGGKADGGLDGATTDTFRISGTGNSRGNGGTVTVSHTGGEIKTAQNVDESATAAAFGILAQSVGGGGGLGGSIVIGATDSIGTGLDMGSDRSQSGNGGDVEVKSSASLVTRGNSSIGIFAQSVGGGGGIQGNGDSSSSVAALIGSAGGDGTAGTVTVVLQSGENAAINTAGNSAHGIFAQSAGGSGSSTSTDTKVSVQVNGDIHTRGDNAFGIFAQSVGDGRGHINVQVNSGATVTGGGSAPVAGLFDGAAVVVMDAPTATLTNLGTLESSSGTAIIGTGTTLTIYNSGTIDGNICKDGNCSLGSDSTALAVADDRSTYVKLLSDETSVLASGKFIDIDIHMNDGSLVVGGEQNVIKTQHLGDLYHSDSAGLFIELGGTEQGIDNDWLAVDGIFEIDGLLDVSLLTRGGDQFTPVAGDSFDILSADNLVGKFDVLSLASLDPGLFWEIDYIKNNTSDDFLRLSVVSAIPVPASVWLFGSGLLGLVGMAAKKQLIR